jgi:hypothetical protein
LWVGLFASAGCFSGPTSDWPFSDEDKGGPTSSGGVSEEAPKPSTQKPASGTGGSKDGRAESDQGSGKSPPNAPGVPAAGSDSSSGSLDAGRPAIGLDAGVAAPRGDASASDGGSDSALPSAPCSGDQDGPSYGACYGVYCAIDEERMQQSAQPSGACSSDEELSLACDGEITRVVAECAQDDALMLGLGNTVARCARRAPSLSRVGSDCMDCYVDEMLCAARNCLASCLAGESADCTSCRLTRCGGAFRSCSGLPVPDLSWVRTMDAGTR